MKKMPFLLILCGLALLCPTVSIVAADPEPEHHELTGPVSLIWESQFGNGSPTSVAASPDGSTVFVAGDSSRRTAAYDEKRGNELWSSNGSRGNANSIAVSPDGAMIFVTGRSWQSAWPDPGSYRIWGTEVFDAASGDEVWSAYGGRGEATSIAVSPDGTTVFVTGTARSAYSANYDCVTKAHDSATGDMVWTASYDGPSSGSDFGRSIAVSSDGLTVFVTGYSEGDYATFAYDAISGYEIWTDRCDGPEYGTILDIGSLIAVSPDGSTVFVTGSLGSYSDSDYTTVAYDAATGEEIWGSLFDGPASGRDWPHALAVSPDGTMIFVTGTSEGLETGQDYTTIAYDTETGAELWCARYAGPESSADYGWAVAVSSDGRTVIVTGMENLSGWGDKFSNYVTLAYDAFTGGEIWSARYDRWLGVNEIPSSIAIRPSGNTVYVTIPYATVAYEYYRKVPQDEPGSPSPQ